MMNLRTLVCTIPLLLQFVLSGQNPKTDSLHKILLTERSDTTRCKILIALMRAEDGDKNKTEVLKIINTQKPERQNKAEIRFYKKTLAEVYDLSGLKALRRNEYLSAFDNYSKSLALHEELKDTSAILNTQFNLALIYKKTGNIPKALKYMYGGLTLSEQCKDTLSMIFPLSEIGLIQYEMKDYPNSFKTYEKLLLLSSLTHDDWSAAFSLRRIARLKWMLNKRNEALSDFNKSISLLKEIGQEGGIANVYSDISNLYNDDGNSELAIEFMYKCLDIHKNLRDTGSIAASFNNLGLIFQKNNELRKAIGYYETSLKLKPKSEKESFIPTLLHLGETYFLLRQFDKAISVSEQALELSEELKFPEHIRKSSEQLFKLYTFSNKPELALQMHEKFLAMRDSLNSQEIVKTILNYQFEEKEKNLKSQAAAEIQLAETKSLAEKKRQLLILYSVSGILLVVIIFSVLLFKRFRITQKQKIVIQEKNREVEEKNKDILDSIRYAKRIQTSLLPTDKYIDRVLSKKD